MSKKNDVSEAVNSLLSSYEMTNRNPYALDAQTIWLYEMGILTPSFLDKVVLGLYLLDKGVRSVEIEYDKNKRVIRLDIGIRSLHFWFRKNIILEKIKNVIKSTFSDYDVELNIEKYKAFSGDDNEKAAKELSRRAADGGQFGSQGGGEKES